MLAGVSRPAVDLWLDRYTADGIAGLLDHRRGPGREQVPALIRARVPALSRTSPPSVTGLSHWSSREMASYIARTEGVLRGETVARERAPAAETGHIQGR